MTNIEIYADVAGTFWWPMGEDWQKLGCEFNVSDYQRRCVNGGRGKRGITLREAVDAFTSEHGGDSASGCLITDGILIVRRGNRTRSFPLSMFPSIADMLTDEV